MNLDNEFYKGIVVGIIGGVVATLAIADYAYIRIKHHFNKERELSNKAFQRLRKEKRNGKNKRTKRH